MGRRPISDDQKQRMREGRQRARNARGKASKALQDYQDQFTKPTFWAKQDEDLVKAVAKAVDQSESKKRQAEIRRLERRLAKLKDQES